MILYGFCGGAFGRDSYDDKRIEAVGPDWIVARGIENGKTYYTSVGQWGEWPHRFGDLMEYTRPEDER